MNPSGDPPRRHLLRQEEQDEPTPRLEEPMELQSSSDSSSGAQRRAALRFTGANGTTGSQSSSSAATMQTTNSSSSGSSAAFAAAAISNSRRHRHLIFTCQGITTGGGSSTASSSTDETEARERCFGSIDMQPLTGSSAVAAAAAAAGRHSTISLFNPVTRHRQYASLVCQSQGADRLVLESGHPSMSGPGSVGGEDSVDGTKHPLQSSSQPKDGSTSSSSAVQQDTLAYLPPQILRQVLLADFGAWFLSRVSQRLAICGINTISIFCPVHSRSLALRYNQYTRWRRRSIFVSSPAPRDTRIWNNDVALVHFPNPRLLLEYPLADLFEQTKYKLVSITQICKFHTLA
ncbi:unnamed protein product [Schistocephalus solidus]|uniref:Uncharacterized protein n=1 Tax=Schistocephalus solidus TaxID=70667 RepID=A0A183TQY4_SCHSO|nr:unnamed protein product [Schistocephalus solidus]